MFARRLYKLVGPSTWPPEQPDEPLREEERLTQRLYGLDRSSAQFQKRLDELLQDEGWARDLQDLSQHKLVELIDYLDSVRLISTPTKSCSLSPQILDGLDRTGKQFRQGLHVLRGLCSSQAILPATYLMSGKLELSTRKTITYGGCGEIYKGFLGDADVCIKEYFDNSSGGIRQVSCPQSLARLSCPDKL